MAASYADVLLGKLALEYGVVGTAALRECLDAQEAGQRAGVHATLGQVLIKRGFMTHAVLHRLEQWRAYAERARRAHLAVQILLRHGRPPEPVLREVYARVERLAFTEDVAAVLEREGHLSPDERAALERALARAWDALYQREAQELRERLSSPSGQWWTGGALAAAAASPAPAVSGPYAAAAAHSGVYRAALTGAGQALAPQATRFAAALGGAGQPPAAHAPTGTYAPAGGMGAYTAVAPTGAYAPAAPPPASRPQSPPRQATAIRYAPPGFVEKTGPHAPARAPAAAVMHQVRRGPVPLVEPACDIPGYERMQRLGRGRLGVTFKAREVEKNRVVALRVLFRSFTESSEHVEQFYAEIERMRPIVHPNIVRLYGGGEANGHLYHVMEYVDGESVQARINLDGAMPESEVLRWAAQIVRAMDHYSRHGLVHRDIRPSAILLASSRRAVLSELGFDVRSYEAYLRRRHGVTTSRPHYTAPEEGLGAEYVDVRADIYALGITMFHALTGRLPFEGNNPGVLVSKHAREPLPDPRALQPSISAETADLLRRMCAKRVEDRHAHPRELLAEIAWIHSERAGTATPIVPIDPPLPEELEQAAAGNGKPRGSTAGRWWRRLLAALGVGGRRARGG